MGAGNAVAQLQRVDPARKVLIPMVLVAVQRHHVFPGGRSVNTAGAFQSPQQD